jgi:uncharacterized protein
MCKKGCISKKIAKVLVVIGGLNWGLVGLGMLLNKDWNLVGAIFGSMPSLEAVIYLLVGISAVLIMIGCKCKKCPGGTCAVPPVESKM